MDKIDKKYIPYFDMMKGLAIILVVMGHVMLFSFNINPSEPSKFIYFNMPLFFYISGYLAYKRIDSIGELRQKLIHRGIILLFPYVVFLILYGVFTHNTSIGHSLIAGGGRYWFLYDLFIISTFFMCYEYLTRNVLNPWTSMGVWLLPLCVLIAIKLYINTMQCEDVGNIVNGLTNYYRYFLIGYLCRKYVTLNRLLFENEIAFAVAFLAYFANWYFFEWHNWILIFTGTLGAIIVLQNFFRNIDADSRIGRLLIYIGRCSLGIYVIHYFFIPDISSIAKGVLLCGNPFIWQLTCALLVAIPIVAASIFVYKLIEMNRWLFLLFFGKLFNK